MIKCPNPDCGHENVDGTQFCEGCGEELTTDGTAAAAPAAGATIKCPACDNINPAENAVCEVCGAELKPADTAVAAATPAAPDASGAAASPATVVQAAVAADTPPAGAAPVTADVPGLSDSSPADAAPVVAAGDTTSGVTPPEPSPLGTPAAGGIDLQPGKVKLTVEQGMSVGAQFVLGDPEVLVGREDEEEGIYPDIDLSDQDAGYVHRRHAMLKFENGQLLVTHLGGANKTRINNRPLPDNEPQPANLGDKIAFGKVVLRVQAA